jgi:hypothetical protein
MALVPQTVEVPFEGGVDTKTDRKKVIPGKLLNLENAIFDGQEIRSRAGSEYLADGKVGGGSLTSANALSVLGGELLRWDDTGVYGRASTTAAPWVQRADAVDANPLEYEVEQVAQRARSCEVFDSASRFGLTVFLWSEVNDTARSLRVTVVDDVTGVRHQDAVEVVADMAGADSWRIQARVVACGGCLLIFYGISVGIAANLWVRKIIPSSPGVLQTAQVVGTMVVDGARAFPYEFDVQDVTVGVVTPSTTGTFLLAYGQAAGVRLVWWTVNPSVATGYAVDGIDQTQPPTTGGATSDYYTLTLKVSAALDRAYLLFTNRSSLRLELHTYNATTHALVAHTNVGASVAGGLKLATVERAAGVMTAYVEQIGTTSPIGFVQWNAAGTVTIALDMLWLRALRLAGQVLVLDGRYYLPTFHVQRGTTDAAGIQPTVFLVDLPIDNNSPGRMALRALGGDAGGPFAGTWLLPHSPTYAEGVPVLLPRRTRIEFDANSGTVVDVSAVGLVCLTLSQVAPHVLTRLEETSTLHVGGALPALFDVGTWAEDGFRVQPEDVSGTMGGGGALSAGTYSWVVCYEWMDGRGRIHRSAPSVPVTLTATAGQRVTLVVPYLHHTRKSNVRLALYRTLADGIVFYRATSSRDAFVQPPTIIADSASLFDGVADSTIEDNEILPYGGAQGGSVGGELWHRPPPAYRFAHKHQAHLFVIPMDDPFSVRYTLPLTEGEGPAWADELEIQVPSAHGKAVALATVDDKLLILCERGAYAVYGNGPLRNGLDNSYTDPMYVTGSVGCSAPGSVVETPDGIMYAAASGIHLLTRGLETVKLGAPVDLYASGFSPPDFTRAIQLPHTKELRWYTAGGRTLVYSSEWAQWGTWTLQPTLDAVIFEDVVHYADGTGVRKDNLFLDTEVGTPIPIVAETAWLKWAGMQGLQRVWKAYLLGTTEVSARVRSDVYYDYDDTAPGQTLEEVFPGSTEGGPPTFRIRQTMAKQLCTALRFKWTITRESAVAQPGGLVGLSSLTLEFGAQRGPSKRKVLKYQGT